MPDTPETVLKPCHVTQEMIEAGHDAYTAWQQSERTDQSLGEAIYCAMHAASSPSPAPEALVERVKNAMLKVMHIRYELQAQEAEEWARAAVEELMKVIQSYAARVEELALDGMPAVHPYAIVRYKREGERWRVTSVEQTEDDPEAEL